MTTISNIRSEYGDKSQLAIRRVAKSFIVSGKIAKIESARGCEYITIKNSDGEITGCIKPGGLSKTHWIKFRGKKTGDDISIKGTLYKTLKNDLGIEVAFVEN